jgi:hypothetical protein
VKNNEKSRKTEPNNILSEYTKLEKPFTKINSDRLHACSVSEGAS